MIDSGAAGTCVKSYFTVSATTTPPCAYTSVARTLYRRPAYVVASARGAHRGSARTPPFVAESRTTALLKRLRSHGHGCGRYQRQPTSSTRPLALHDPPVRKP